MSKKLKLLELFAGSRSVGNEAERLGYKVFSVDWEKFEGIDLSIDIENLKLKDIPFVPDIVWLSFDCTTYCIPAISTHRIKTPETLLPKSPYAIKCDKVNQHCLKLLRSWLKINPNMVYYIENPRGGLRKMEWMQNLPIRNTVWIPRPMCHNKRKDKDGILIDHCHHETAPRGSKTGTQGKKNSYERSKIPNELCHEILTTETKSFKFCKKKQKLKRIKALK